MSRFVGYVGLQRKPMVETEQYKAIRAEILREVRTGRRFIIAIDGRDGSGKSSLARYLGWQLCFAVVETDLFMKSLKPLKHRFRHLNAVINAKRIAERPLIVEGVQILQTLEAIAVDPNFLIRVRRQDQGRSPGLDAQYSTYEETYKERIAKAECCLIW